MKGLGAPDKQEFVSFPLLVLATVPEGLIFSLPDCGTERGWGSRPAEGDESGTTILVSSVV